LVDRSIDRSGHFFSLFPVGVVCLCDCRRQLVFKYLWRHAELHAVSKLLCRL